MTMRDALVRAGYKPTYAQNTGHVHFPEKPQDEDNQKWCPEEWLEQAKLEATHGG